ncbi:SnoaL-like domain-containing protein [Paraflavitalea speifideaquila]|uniref:SnoaL-like domain-containing protein n=1 Tax=Paraflavitalea speifideaquila TaxID=3076558 RepID=UPI0028E488CB|nr:SnoaL-like domain-containing protein [Paraflavitalea speifideiaquila]
MTIQQIADQLVKICRTGEWGKAQQELYAPNAISIEPEATPAFDKETKGLPAIIEKGKKFDSMVETMHSITMSDPVVAEHSFAAVLVMDATMKGHGRMQMKELCVYQVKEGKIVEEQFYM